MNPFQKVNKQKSIFITAGYPEIDSLSQQIELLDSYAIDFIEIGIPFSDPLAKTPLVLMGYINPVLNYGMENFVKSCKERQIASVILPDMSVEIYERFYQEIFESNDLPVTFLITPDTTHARILKIARHCKSSFVYLVSGNSTTGKASDLQLNTEKIREIKEILGITPLMIGFGIKSKEDILRVQEFADGAIIGSAYLKALENGKEEEFLSML